MQVDRRNGFGLPALQRGRLPGFTAPVRRRVRGQLETQRRAAGRVDHAHHDPLQFFGVVRRHRRPAHRVATAAIAKELPLGPIVERIARKPLGVRELQSELERVRVAQRQVELRGGRGGDLDLRVALLEHVFHGTRRHGVAPRLDAVAWERVAAVRMAHDRDGLARAFALGADEDALQGAFGGRRHSAHERCGRLRLRRD
jgi:hypothetical protein